MANVLHVNYIQNCTGSHRGSGTWASWSQDNEVDILGVATCEPKYSKHEWEEMPACADIGDTVYVVWLTFSDGDTFGHESGNLFIAGVYKSRELADQVADTLKESKNEWEVAIPVEMGNGMTSQRIVHNPLHDYFAHLETMNVTPFTVF